ncbi:MAG: glycosyltransferase family 39 protein [Desulfobacterales bacterium]|nr:glycosyltransferase family 39 protein [Desulfobacterales bacterium]
MKETGLQKWGWIALAGVAGFLVLLCLVPPVSRDALVHHLAMPKIYLREGGMVELPGMDWSYYPMNLTLLYWGALAWGSDILPKLIHLAFGLGTAGLIFRHLKGTLGATWGFGGALLFLTTPVVMKLSTTAYVDLGLAFFSFFATEQLLKAREEGFQKSRRVVGAGLLLGLGLGIKYNALPMLLLLAALLVILVSRTLSRGEGRDLKAVTFALLFVGAVGLAYLPTGVRNTLWTGNPIYPMFHGAFQKIHALADAPEKGEAVLSKGLEKRVRLYPLEVRRMLYKESALDVTLLPVRIFFQGEDKNPRLFDGRLSPILSASLLILFLFGKVPRPFRWNVGSLLFLSQGFILIALCMTATRVRYLMPVVPHLAVLSVYALAFFAEGIKKSRQAVLRWAGALSLALFVGYGVWVSGSYAVYLYRYVSPLSYLSGAVSRDDYIARCRFEHPTYLYINAHLKPTDRLFFVGLGKRGYYCDIPYVPDPTGTHFVTLAGLSSGGELRSPLEMAHYLKRRGITHIVANMNSAWKHVMQGDEWTPEARRNLEIFLSSRARLIHKANGVFLFELNHSATGE